MFVRSSNTTKEQCRMFVDKSAVNNNNNNTCWLKHLLQLKQNKIIQQSIIPFAAKKLELLSIKLKRCQIFEGKFKLD